MLPLPYWLSEIPIAANFNFCEIFPGLIEMLAFSLGLPSAFYTACTQVHSHLQLMCLLTYTYIYSSTYLLKHPIVMAGEKEVDLQKEIRRECLWFGDTSLIENVGQSHHTHVIQNSESGKSQVSEELGKPDKPTLCPPQAVRVSRGLWPFHNSCKHRPFTERNFLDAITRV